MCDKSLNIGQKVDCTLLIDVPGLGYLDNATDEDVGTKDTMSEERDVMSIS
jgi:hypothetical protein